MKKFELKKNTYVGFADAALTLYKQHFGLFFKITAIMFLAPTLILKFTVASLEIPAGLASVMTRMGDSDDPSYAFENFMADMNPCAIICVAFLIWLISLILFAVYSGPIVVAARQKAFSVESHFVDYFRLGFNKYLNLVIATFFFGLIAMTIYGVIRTVISIPFAIVGILMVGSMDTVTGWLVIPLMCGGELISIIASTFLISFISLYPAAIVLEGKNAFAAFDRSMNLVRKNLWLTWRVLAGMILLAGLFNIASDFAFNGLQSLLTSWDPNLEVFAMALSATGTSLVTVFISPMIFIAITLLFYELKVRKEGFDLDVMIENF